MGGHTLDDAGVRLADKFKEGRGALSEDHGVFAETDKDGRYAGVDCAADSGREVDADQEGEEQNWGGVLAIRVVVWFRVCCQ